MHVWLCARCAVCLQGTERPREQENNRGIGGDTYLFNMQYIMIKKKKDSVLGNSMGFVQISECFTNENKSVCMEEEKRKPSQTLIPWCSSSSSFQINDNRVVAVQAFVKNFETIRYTKRNKTNKKRNKNASGLCANFLIEFQSKSRLVTCL